MDYQNRITSDPKVMLGKPGIKGTRITVELILHKIAGGFAFEEILQMYPHLMYPHLTREDILAAVGYAADVIASEETFPGDSLGEARLVTSDRGKSPDFRASSSCPA
jgi:uncharacterized protein (DUF433 family)